MADQPDLSVVVVTLNGREWVERCLESVAGADELIVVDHGSTDGTLELVRDRFPQARLIEQENRGMGGGNNAGMRVAAGRYFLLLNSDAWILDDGLARLVEFADSRPDAAVIGPRLLNTDGTLQRSVRAFPTLWRLATEYLFLRKIAPRSDFLNAFYGGSFAHDRVFETDWLFGAALLVRREAADAVGLFDERFFMFSEEVDWCYRFRAAGWNVLFFPGAEAVHVGGATHGGRLYRENLRGHLHFFAKHYGLRQAERARRLLLFGVRLRARLFRGERRQTYADAARFLASGSASSLVK
jgi:N-acetylglucosaminyl-diphospho-decaprenol L-rhamnosyltransferase